MPSSFGDRQKNVAELSERLIASINESLARSIKCCVNCEHFDEDKAYCKGWNTNPPPRIIAFGCEQFSDIIPF